MDAAVSEQALRQRHGRGDAAMNAMRGEQDAVTPGWPLWARHEASGTAAIEP
jgi:hypothetical protein